MTNRMVFIRAVQSQYFSYLIIGGVVGLITLLSQRCIAWFLSSNAIFYYMVSVLLAYLLGIFINFTLQKKFTFFSIPIQSKRKRQILRFFLVAIIGSFVTVVLAAMFKYEMCFSVLFGGLSGTIAFALASILVSVLTYSLNSKFVFK